MAPNHGTSSFILDVALSTTSCILPDPNNALAAVQSAGPVLEHHSSPPLAIAPRQKTESPEDTAVITCIRPSKEWVLPPRPKPGRKPSTDTPPTKRKAQNRAAQRAFRERRAARVVELEDRLLELESEKEEKESRLTSTLMRISAENQELKSVTDELKEQLELFKQFQAQQAAMAAVGRGIQMPMAMAVAQQQPAHHLVSPAPSPGSNDQTYSSDILDRALNECLPVRGRSTATPASTMTPTTGTQYQYASPSAGTVPIRRPLKKQRQESTSSSHSTVSSPHTVTSEFPPSYTHRPSFHVATHPSPLHAHEPEKDSGHSDTCGLCHSDGNCLCSDIGIKPSTDVFPERAPSSVLPETAETNSKRLKGEREEDLEMDFTHAFQTAEIKRNRRGYLQQQHEHQNQLRREEYDFNDSTDFTSAFSSDRSDMKTNVRAADPCGFCSSDTPCVCAEAAAAEASNPLIDSQIMEDGMSTTLPPLRNDRRFSQNKLHTLHPEPISDVTVTASAAPASNFAPGTCEACQRDPMQTLFCTSLASKQQNAGESGGCGNCNQPGGCCGGSSSSANRDTAFIPCSAAYRTLSRHKGFKAVELPSLVGKLSTKGGQVEVASVASILRELDRRLYN
ncbi:hypothetical protein V1506DRAFT_37930 [Lipomyces tetrasporus]